MRAGYLFSFGYVFLVALSVILFGQIAETVPASFTLLFSTTLCIVFFHLVNIKRIPETYKTAMRFKKEWLVILFSVAIFWFCSVSGPAFIAPDMFLLTEFMTMCILGLVFETRKEKNIFLYLGAAGVLTCFLILLDKAFQHPDIHPKNFFIGLLYAVFSAIFSFIYANFAFSLNKKSGLSATQILAIRFWVLELLAFVTLPKNAYSLFFDRSMIFVLLITVFSIILPVFLFIKSVIAIGAEKHSINTGFIPIVGYVLFCFFVKNHFNFQDLFIYCLVAIFLFMANGFSIKKLKPQ